MPRTGRRTRATPAIPDAESAAGAASRSRAGRPRREAAEQLGSRILESARTLFLSEGYGATSVEAIAQRAGISKRTFYARYDDKADVFEAVLHDVVASLRPAAGAPLVQDDGLAANLTRLARVMLQAALMPDALSLHRLIVGESARFPRLAAAVNRQAASEQAVALIARLLARERRLAKKQADFAARQFLHMVITIPQRLAIGLGAPLTPAQLRTWPEQVVALFLEGVGPR
ncbi:MAG TPA: TetR/AcrR family transcriptional regulator [Usitatibacter sp.]|nr:TetR/AcrR family transcriptional regulator [Usitatibacter sp.]